MPLTFSVERLIRTLASKLACPLWSMAEETFAIERTRSGVLLQTLLYTKIKVSYIIYVPHCTITYDSELIRPSYSVAEIGRAHV